MTSSPETSSQQNLIAVRRELRYALLAANESCWVYAVFMFLAAIFGVNAPSPLTIFAGYWIALFTGRKLPLMKERWVVLQGAAIGIALVTLLIVIRLQVYAQYALFDLNWLARYAADLISFTRGLSSAALVTLAIVYVFVRGLGFGQRPLTLWFTGFQFRIGIVVFFGTLVLAAFVRTFDISTWIFVYFFLSLLAIALARMDELGSRLPLGPRWAVTLLAAVGLVIFLSLGVLQVLTLQILNEIVILFSPVGAVLSFVIVLIAIPFGYLAAWLIDLLSPLFKNLRQLSDILANLIPPGANDALKQAQQNTALLDILGPLLKTLFVVCIVVAIGIMLARALNRRMKQAEDEAFAREAIGNEEDAERVLSERRKKQTASHRRAGDMAAESIRRIYAALVARAAEAGLPRGTAETPYEFLPRLEQAFPDEADQVQSITEAYIAVHYGEYKAPQTEVQRVRAAWEEIKKRIKRKR